MNMYGECESLSEAWEAFNKLPGRSMVSWVHLSGYAEYGPALNCMLAGRYTPRCCDLCLHARSLQ